MWKNKIQTIMTFLHSPIGNEESIGSYELHIAVKDYCFGRDDRLIGVSVMQLKDIQDQVGIMLYYVISKANNEWPNGPSHFHS